MGGASSSDLVNWSKRTTPLCNPRNGALFKMGSVIHYGGLTKATMGFHEVFGNPSVFHLKNQTFPAAIRSATGWTPTPGCRSTATCRA